MRSTLMPALPGRQFTDSTPKPVAFALWSGNLREATLDLPDVVLPHVFSRENNLEWAFRREDLYNGAAEQISLLARSVKQLPDHWPPTGHNVEVEAIRLLGLDPNDDSIEFSWQNEARDAVLSCHPPLHELSERSHGLALLRWLLHRVFPYPTFLIDETQLATRMRVDAISGGTAKDGSLLNAIEQFKYSGVLAGFEGTRWWRSGIEDWLYSETDGLSGDSYSVADLAIRHGAVSSRRWLRPVVVIDSHLARLSMPVEIEETVRVLPDDWPVFADDAFARIEDVRQDSQLRALVDPAQRDLLSNPETAIDPE
jgi:hypothetical protein